MYITEPKEKRGGGQEERNEAERFFKEKHHRSFLMGKELHFTGSLVPAQACGKKLIRQKNKQKYGYSTQGATKQKIRKQRKTCTVEEKAAFRRIFRSREGQNEGFGHLVL